MPSPNSSILERLARSPLPVFVLVAIAGGTDALVMLHSKEWLAVYMTGNSTKLSQSLVQGAFEKTIPLICVIACFLAFTTLAAWLGTRFPRWRAALSLTLTAILLACAVPLTGEQFSPLTTCLVAAGMGAINQALADQPGVTFITGTFISVGRQLASRKFGAAALGMLRWISWIVGAAAGTVLNILFGPGALAAIALVGLVCALTATVYGSTMHAERLAH
ncbi:YoaK family protein [Caballeronia sp. GAWG2-1]|uniref:YoaK family protein n=1 Tax=Caballeronia sp. GAWG2-1 TaxID=2921744 RepID=UPI002028D292|nr:YoaK family protein [Caballeronia sp. GAWG2-1]